MRTGLSIAFVVGLAVSTALVYQNCSKVEFSTPSQVTASGEPVPPTIVDACSSLENSTSETCKNLPGFSGNLYVEPASTMVEGYHGLTTTQPIGVTMVDAYIRPDWKQPVTVNLSALSIPETNFSLGFKLPNGNLLSDSGGTVLNEWFALDLNGTFHLDGNDTPGDYQFAIVSDDGSRVYYSTDSSAPTNMLIDNQDPGGNSTPVVGSPGVWQRGSQSALMGCGSKYANNSLSGYTTFDLGTIVELPLTVASRVKMHIEYFQGPRTALAAYFMYRKVPSGTNGSDPACGMHLNFVPGQSDFDSLFSGRGWKTVGTANLN